MRQIDGSPNLLCAACGETMVRGFYLAPDIQDLAQLSPERGFMCDPCADNLVGYVGSFEPEFRMEAHAVTDPERVLRWLRMVGAVGEPAANGAR